MEKVNAIKIIDNEFNGFLESMDIVDAGISARELRGIQNYSSLGSGTKGSVVEKITERGGQFYTGREVQSGIGPMFRFSPRCPNSMWFAYVPLPEDCWYQVSKLQYEYGIYLTKELK